MKKKKQGILEEEEEFLDYLSRKNHDEDSRKEENLIKKFGEEKYKRIYSFVGGRKTGALPKREGDKKTNVLYINDEGLKFLEERQKEKSNKLVAILTLIFGVILALITLFYAVQTYRLNEITYNSFEVSNRPYFYIRPISLAGMNVNGEMLQLTITIINFGDTPGRLLKIESQTGTGDYTSSKDLVVLGSGTERNVTLNKIGIGNQNNFTVNITYTGIGKLSNKNYSSSRNIYIEKTSEGDLAVYSEEGQII